MLLGVASTKAEFIRLKSTIYTFLRDKKLRRKWIRAASLRRKNYKWKASDRVYSVHFPGGRKCGGNNITAVFPRRDLKTGDIVWPVDISGLLQEKSYVVETEERERESNASGKNTVITAGGFPSFSDENEPDSESKEVNKGSEVKENFGVKTFMLSDSDIRFYTGLPNYNTFAALYIFLRPRSGTQLNYYNGYTNAPQHPSYVVSRGRPRNLNEIDELFRTMNRLRLGLLEKELANRFNIKQTEVSRIFFNLQWVHRTLDCLGQLSFTADRDTMKMFSPKCFKPEHEDVYFIIDCTELFLKKPSQVIQQSATWSEYKGHNTGNALIALSPVAVFVADVYSGSKPDEEILSESGILARAHRGDIWLADKDFIVQHIFDDYGVRTDMPVKLEGEKKFSEEEVQNRRNFQV